MGRNFTSAVQLTMFGGELIQVSEVGVQGSEPAFTATTERRGKGSLCAADGVGARGPAAL